MFNKTWTEEDSTAPVPLLLARELSTQDMLSLAKHTDRIQHENIFSKAVALFAV